MAILNPNSIELIDELINTSKIKSGPYTPFTPEQLSRYFKKVGWREYASWFIGLMPGEDANVIGKYVYPFTDDWKNINRKALLIVAEEARKNSEGSIQQKTINVISRLDSQLLYEKQTKAKYFRGQNGIFIAKI